MASYLFHSSYFFSFSFLYLFFPYETMSFKAIFSYDIPVHTRLLICNTRLGFE